MTPYKKRRKKLVTANNDKTIARKRFIDDNKNVSKTDKKKQNKRGKSR